MSASENEYLHGVDQSGSPGWAAAEFRSLSDVQDAVHHYGGGIITFFEQRVVEAQSPG